MGILDFSIILLCMHSWPVPFLDLSSSREEALDSVLIWGVY